VRFPASTLLVLVPRGVTPHLLRISRRRLPILGVDSGSHVAPDGCAIVAVREWSTGEVDCFVGVWDLLGVDVPLPFDFDAAVRWLSGLAVTPTTQAQGGHHA
jgi:hypothetical protein